MNSKVSVKNVIKFAGAYIALEIGSGFATGQEIIQFFTSYGVYSIGAIFISMILYIWVGGKLMAMGYLNIENDHPYQMLCGKTIGTIYEILVVIYLFAMLSVMISGTGATLKEYYGISHMAGSLFMTILVFITFACGLEKMVNIVGMIGPIIIAFTVFVALATIMGEAEISVEDMILAENRDFSIDWIMSGILYVSYNIFGAVTFLMALGKTASSKKEAQLGGILGGGTLMVTVLILNFALTLRGDEISNMAVPVLYLAHDIGPLVGTIFAITILLGIYSTAAPGLWTICSNLSERRRNSQIVAALLSIDALLLGQFPFQRLVAVIYPIAGYLSLILLACILVRKPDQRH